MLLVSGGLRAQDVGFKECRAPKVPIGYLRGSGRLVFGVDAKGRPDTSTVRVVRVIGMSGAALRSAVRRQLSACRFDIHKAGLAGPVELAQSWEFESTKVRFGGAEPAGPELPPDSVIAPALPPVPVPDSAAVLEERPRVLDCPHGYRVESAGIPNGEPHPEDESGGPPGENSGSVKIQFEVDTLGRVASGTITPVASTDPTLINDAVRNYAACRYTVGRIGGVPVPVLMSSVYRVQVTTETTTRRIIR